MIISIPLLYAILFHSGKTSRHYKNFLFAAQILNISHDILYNFSFAPVMDETYHVLYSSGGLLTYLGISMSWQCAIVFFVRMQCAFVNFSALFYRHQIVQFSGSRWKFAPWKCILIAVIFDVFISLVLLPMNILSAGQGNWRDIVKKEFLPDGTWLLEKPSLLIVPRLSDRLFELVGAFSIIVSVLSAILFTMTAKLITKTLKDNRSTLSKSNKVLHARAISALRAQAEAAAPLIFVTIPLNIMLFSNSIVPRLPWIAYVILLGLPSFQSIAATLITIYFQTSYRRFFCRAFNNPCTSKGRRALAATVTSSHNVNAPNSEIVLSHNL